jgi:hypothetical protein
MEVIVLPLTFVSGFAHDIAMSPNPDKPEPNREKREGKPLKKE